MKLTPTASTPCKQTKAAHAAIGKVEVLLLERHLHHRVNAAVRSDDERERQRVLTNLLNVFEARRKNG